ncbi:MAG: helix-turn-helix transcriptional regulator [Treponema sp.]|nr:helix-turn-helix transcriptional regulator [Treponema sp.]
MSFRNRLREEISYKGFTIKELSAKVGVSNSTFLSYVDARGVLPNVETAVKIAKALGVSVEYLVTGENSNKNVNIQENRDKKEILHIIEKFEDNKIKAVKTIVNAIAEM